MSAHKLSILHVIARLNVGGAALHVLQLAREQERRGHDVLVVAGTLHAGEESMDYVADELEVDVLNLPALQRPLSAREDLTAILRLRQIIRQRRPDVLHTHTAKAGATGRLAALAAGDAKPRAIVHTFHGHVLSGYFSRRWERLFRRIEWVLAHATGTLVAVSDEVRDELVGFGVARPHRFVVVPYGFDLPEWGDADEEARRRIRAELGLGDDTFAIGWAGRLTAIKRPLDLIRTLRAVLDEDVDAALVLVGDGELRGETEALARELDVADRTTFAGFQQRIRDWYAAVDVSLLTSANEGTPVVAIESLAAKRPVVATAAGGTGTVVVEGESGYLLPVGDTAGLARRLVELARDPALRARLGAAGAVDVRSRFATARMADELEAVYERRPPPTPSRIMRSDRKPLATALRTTEVGRTPRSLRIVLLSQYFSPEVGATQSRMQSFAEHLAARGHQVTVVCEFPNHPHGVISPDYRGRIYEDDRSNPYRVLRVWVKASEEKTQRSRMQFYLSYMAFATAMAPVAGRADIVVATTPPLFTGVAGLALARLNRAPFVLDVRDLWPAAAVSLHQISEGMSLQLAEWLERLLYREAAAVVAVTRPFCAHVDAIRRASPPTTLIPNGTLELFLEAQSQDGAGRAALGAGDGDFLVTFAGTHGIAQGLDTVVEAAGLLDGQARFAFVGDGPLKEPLVQLADERGARNIAFHPQVPLGEMPPLLAASDAILVPLSAHPTFRDFVPSKLIDAMAVGRPVVLSAAGEAVRILELAGAGVVATPEDPEDLARVVRWLREHPTEARAMGERGRAFARSRLRSTQARRLEELLLDVTLPQ